MLLQCKFKCAIILLNTLTKRVGVFVRFSERSRSFSASESGFKSEYSEVHLRVVPPKFFIVSGNVGFCVKDAGVSAP